MKTMIYSLFLLATPHAWASAFSGDYSCFDDERQLRARVVVGPAEANITETTCYYDDDYGDCCDEPPIGSCYLHSGSRAYADFQIFRDLLLKKASDSMIISKRSGYRSGWWGSTTIEVSGRVHSLAIHQVDPHGDSFTLKLESPPRGPDYGRAWYRCAKDKEPYMTRRVFKILTEQEWNRFNSQRYFAGSAADLRDGFIHLATKGQVAGVIDRFFSGIRPVYVVEFSHDDLVQAVKWEPSSSGDIYPHLYDRPLTLDGVSRYWVEN